MNAACDVAAGWLGVWEQTGQMAGRTTKKEGPQMRMFIPAVACFLALVTPSAARAQAGVIVGANFAKLEVSGDAPDAERRTGLVAGVFGTMRLGDRMSIQPEVLYSQKGETFTEQSVDVTIELDYLDIPVLARFTGGRRSGLVVFGGPSFGFKLRARSTFEIDGEKQEEDFGDDVESFDLGFVVGAGVESERFFLDGRYQWGLSDLDADDSELTEVKNRVLSVVVGIRF